MQYADVSSEALTLSVTRGKLDLSSLHPLVVQTARICLGGKGTDVEAGILGASHYLRVGLPSGNTLTEVFACQRVQSESEPIYVGPLGQTRKLGPLCHTVEGLLYTFSAYARSWDASCEQSLSDEVALIRNPTKGAQRLGLVFEFPSAPGVESTQPPLTAMALETRGDSLLLRTWHSYPNERLVVLSETSFTRKERT